MGEVASFSTYDPLGIERAASRPARAMSQAVEALLLCLDPDRIAPPTHDWTAVAELARLHGLTPLLFHRLECHQGLDADLLHELRQDHARQTGVAFFRMRQAAGVFEALEAHQIRFLVLKGMALAERIYASPALRAMGDVDLLVRPEDFPEADRALRELGYARGLMPERPAGECYHIDYSLQGSRLKVELHWHLHRRSSPFLIPVDDLWARAVALEVAGHRVQGLCPTDELVYLSLHIAKHRFCAGLRPFCDLALLLKAHPPDWNAVIDCAREWKGQRQVATVLLVLFELFPARLPEDVLAWLEALSPSRDMLVFARRLVLHPDHNASELEMKVVGNRHFMGRGWRTLVPPRHLLRRLYKGVPWPLSYLHYWLDRLLGYLGPLLRLLLDRDHRDRVRTAARFERWINTSSGIAGRRSVREDGLRANRVPPGLPRATGRDRP